MKKNLTTQFWGCLSATLIFVANSFQASSQALPASFTSLSQAEAAAPSSNNGSVGVNSKIQRSFYRHFENAQNLNWESVDQGYIAHFMVDDREAHVSFGKSGRINYTVLCGTGKHLPEKEKSLVQSDFKDYEITATKQVSFQGVNLWIVTIQNCTDIIKVRVMENETYELERSRRVK